MSTDTNNSIAIVYLGGYCFRGNLIRVYPCNRRWLFGPVKLLCAWTGNHLIIGIQSCR
jgi:hypothetical protein